jgi:hypothetical protein
VFNLTASASASFSRSPEGIGHEEQPILVAASIRLQPAGLGRNAFLDNAGYVLVGRKELRASRPTAKFAGRLSRDLYQVDLRRLALSEFEVRHRHIAVRGHVVSYDLHHGLGDPIAIRFAERPAEIEK